MGRGLHAVQKVVEQIPTQRESEHGEGARRAVQVEAPRLAEQLIEDLVGPALGVTESQEGVAEGDVYHGLAEARVDQLPKQGRGSGGPALADGHDQLVLGLPSADIADLGLEGCEQRGASGGIAELAKSPRTGPALGGAAVGQELDALLEWIPCQGRSVTRGPGRRGGRRR